jgi:sugar lactone lactonase YvrE
MLGTASYGDCALTCAYFNLSNNYQLPSGIAVDASGNLVVGDTNNIVVRYIYSQGETATIGGMANVTDNYGNPGDIVFSPNPLGVACDPSGNSYIADTGNNVIRMIDPTGAITVLAGSGSPGSSDGQGSGASFSAPAGVAFYNGYVYVADTGNNTIRRIDSGGNTQTIAGTAGTTGSQNGNSFSQATFNAPNALASDGTGNIYISDSQNYTIRVLNVNSWQVSLFAGQNGVQAAPGIGGNALTTATFGSITGIACDPAGSVYAVDNWNGQLWKITPGGWVKSFGTRPSFNSTGPLWSFSNPLGIACDSNFNVYVADNGGQIVLFDAQGVGTGLAGELGWGNVSAAGILNDGATNPPPNLGWCQNPMGLGITNLGDVVITVPTGIMIITAPLPSPVIVPVPG